MRGAATVLPNANVFVLRGFVRMLRRRSERVPVRRLGVDIFVLWLGICNRGYL
jgi:hypothetical protein